ncbi:hypothetical protein [Labrys neptuniae]
MTRHRRDLSCVAEQGKILHGAPPRWIWALKSSLLGVSLAAISAATPALAACSTSGSTQTCTGDLSGGVQVNAGPTTLNVNTLSGPVNGQVRLQQNGGDGGNGHDGALFVPPASGGGGGSGGGSAPTVTGQSFNQTTGVAVINYSDGSIITLTPKAGSGNVYTKQTQTPKSGGGYDTTSVDIPAAITPNDADGSITISLGTNGDAGTMTIKPGAGGGSLTGGGLNLNYAGTGQTLTTSGQPGVIAISRGGDGGDGGDYYLGGGGARGGSGGAGGSATVTSKGNITVTNGYGVMAQSIGGSGGHGGGSYTVVGSGGEGGKGGAAGAASVTAGEGTITTYGDNSGGLGAISQGGRGGAGGSAGGIVASSGDASGAGRGGSASVTALEGLTIVTHGANSHGLLAQSIGGSGGSSGSAGGLGAIGGQGGTGGDAGTVDARNFGDVTTSGTHSFGILAQSIGGGGGSGSGGGGLVVLGADGAAGGAGGNVTAVNGGSITTKGFNSTGIFAQSIGGGGGDGGSSGGLVAIGGKGSTTSNAGSVNVTNAAGGSITTYQSFSQGIFAQSVGGGGGNGGSSGGLFTVGGQGGSGGNGGTVTVTSAGLIETGVNAKNNSSLVTDSAAIFAQSVGGGGGNGGNALAVGTGITVALGGKGGVGGTGANVSVLRDNADPSQASSASIITWGDRSAGIFAQSVGGGGGNGGFGISANGGLISASVALGGSGGDGGGAGNVQVDTKGSIQTHGSGSTGVFAQSVGGGGGNGGLAVAGSAGLVQASIALGGGGGKGGDAGTVNVSNLSVITTAGDNASGILAQSVGGGGGNGGVTVAAGLGLASANVGLGGSGEKGGSGKSVTVDSNGDIATGGKNSSAILAQSIGGGGGNGGLAVGAGISGVGASVSLGGSGAQAGHGDTVSVTSTGNLLTKEDNSAAILAQSVGGGGGNGGSTVAGQLSVAGNVNVGLGGTAGGGGNGGAVTVKAYKPAGATGNTATLETDGDNSAGILAQSIGGGGGNGGFAGALALSGGVSAGISLGGGGGSGGSGASVLVDQNHNILTKGDNSAGILAQSIGGGGGNGGFAATLSGSVPLVGVSGSAAVSLGGKGGAGNNAGTVSVTSNGAIQTEGDRSDAVLAQSIGGGGGNGGFGLSGSFNVGGVGAASVAIGGSGGAGADASLVTVKSTGPILTKGEASNGLVAQSIGGGGGNGGFSGSASLSTSVSIGVAVGGTGGNGGNGGGVSLTNQGSVQVTGTNAAGVLAQSIGGGGGNGGSSIAATLGGSAGLSVAVGRSGGSGGTASAVNVTSNGEIVNGAGTGSVSDGSYKATTANGGGILAQSIGGGGGNGGFSGSLALGGAGALSLSLGGSGGDGGTAGTVNVQNGTQQASNITTLGDLSAGITAQSIGGGGGNGGFGIGVSGSGVVSLSASVGGKGGSGNTASAVTVGSTGDIVTFGNFSAGIAAQSIGGGGGNGGFAVSGSIALAPEGGGSAAVAVGGSAGSGATAGNVGVTNKGIVATFGTSSTGILAQSLGGGGGNGGFAAAGAITVSPEGGASIAVAVGGAGGNGGTAGKVTVLQTGAVATEGDQSTGVLAQSIGGGGGNGGFAGTLSANIGNGVALGASVGGSGGDGAKADAVEVTVNGDVSTDGILSSGVVGQSIGGSGGNGGFSVAGSLQIGQGGSLNASIGGFGGDGGKAGSVNVSHTGNMQTKGDLSLGLLAQSIGGGGGNGGFAGSLSATIGEGVALGVSVGGFGGGGATAGNAKASNIGNIATLGAGSTAILAQSIGGNGGNGGASVAGAIGVGEQNVSLAVSVGGFGGDGAKAGSAEVDSTGLIYTKGALAHGLAAQSIGGGGGNGGFSVAGNLNVSTGTGGSASVSVGGGGGSGSTGGDVTIKSNIGKVLPTDNSATIETDGDGSNAIYAQSIGGGGGSGGFSGALSLTFSQGATAGFGLSVGGFGGTGNHAGTVNVTSVDNILTKGDGSNGVLAQSIGGGGGDGGFSGAATITGGASGSTQAGVSASLGGFGGAAGNAGAVNIDSKGLITTLGDHAYGVLAQSIGGGGGNGGMSFAGAVGVSQNAVDVALSVGGFGGAAGTGGNVSVTRNGMITTAGDYSIGLAGQSIGGGGGNGGMSITGAFGGTSSKNISASLGGFGGAGTGAGLVTIGNVGDIGTKGIGSQAILAQSIGGGGGNGGLAGSAVFGVGGENTNLNFGAAVGGKGGSGGTGSDVKVTSNGNLQTQGDAAQGILAQSIGGGGGNGGSSLSGVLGVGGASQGRTINVSFSVGGLGGDGNTAGNVTVDQSGSIQTDGNGSHGIQAQSIGGGGGNGGQANSLALLLTKACTLPVVCTAPEETKNNFSFQATVGGFGGTGNDAGTVTVGNDGVIVTKGDASSGIFAQSIGGGGGQGGSAIIGLQDVVPSPYNYATLAAMPFGAVGIAKNYVVAVGGYGGSAGNGNTVSIDNQGQILTQGIYSWGIFAQSVGGGGGNSGNAVAGLTGTIGLGGGALANLLGVDSGSAGDGGIVTVTNGKSGDVSVGAIQANGIISSGAIFAQSIGGGGGQGGAGSGLIDIGGDGGAAGNGGAVTVNNYAYLGTKGLFSTGITAQSVGGGGGTGGGGSLSALAIGGAGGAAGNGGTVAVANAGEIFTEGRESNGVTAQSVGGGGGTGGGFLYDKQGIGSLVGSVNLVQVGGSGGASGDGGSVGIANAGFVQTKGDFSNGLFAQSVGGGGGIGGGGLGAVAIGGKSGAGGKGGDVTVSNAAGGKQVKLSNDPSVKPITVSIITTGDQSNAIMAQSVGGGGGSSGETYGLVSFERGAAAGSDGGTVKVTNAGSLLTFGQNSTAIFAQSVGGGGGYAAAATGLGAWGADAGGGGNGGDVSVTNTAELIATNGTNAHGIFAQSIGGGGGVVNSLGGLTVPKPFIDALPETAQGVVTNLLDGKSVGIGFAGSAGGDGKAGDVTINQTGDITTAGSGSFAILAQSTGKTNGNIAITVNADSTIIGGTGMGAGVGFLDGATNTLSNAGLIADLGKTVGLALDKDRKLIGTGWIDGLAIYGTAGNEAVTNTNLVTGSVKLGAGLNSFDNKNGAWFVTGDTIQLGDTAAHLFSNSGFMAIGGINRVFTTNETGYFSQKADGTYMLDFDLDRNANWSTTSSSATTLVAAVPDLSNPGFTDLVKVSGAADLAGKVSINLLNPGKATPGTSDHVIVHTEKGVSDNGMTIDAIPTAVAKYSLIFTDYDAILRTKIDFSADGLTRNGHAVGNAINAIQTDQTSPKFVPLAAAIFFQPDLASLQKTYDSIDGEGTAGVQQTLFSDSGAFMRSVMQQADFWRNANAVDLTGKTVGGCSADVGGKTEKGASFCDTRLWRAWVTGYGGSSSFDGNTAVGSGNLKTHNQGLAAGIDYQLDPNYLIGLSVGGGHSSFGVEQRATTGKVDAGHFALYGAAKYGNFYANGLLGFDVMHATIQRYAMIQGTDAPVNPVAGAYDALGNSFDGRAISGRLEGGYKANFSGVNVTPFAALQFSSLHLDGSTEHAQGTNGGLALNYAGRTINSFPSFLGAQIDTRFYFGETTYLEPFLRASWVHEFANRRSVEAGFTAAPGYNFVVYGASAPRDSALVEAGVNLVSASGLSVYGKFSGNFSKSSHDLTGSGGLRYSW